MVRGGYRFSLWVNHLASTVFSQEVVSQVSQWSLTTIFSGAETLLFRAVHYLGAVPLADSVVKGLSAVALMEVEHLIKAEFVKGQKGLSVFVHALREVEHLVKAEFVKGQKGLSVFVLALMEVEHLKP